MSKNSVENLSESELENLDSIIENLDAWAEKFGMPEKTFIKKLAEDFQVSISSLRKYINEFYSDEDDIITEEEYLKLIGEE